MASRNPRVGFVSLGCPKPLVQNGRVIVTGCLGAKPQKITACWLAARVGRRLRVLVDDEQRRCQSASSRTSW